MTWVVGVGVGSVGREGGGCMGVISIVVESSAAASLSMKETSAEDLFLLEVIAGVA